MWNCCPERYGKFQSDIPSTSGAICEKPQGGAFAPPAGRGIFQYFFCIGDAMLTRNVVVPSPARTVCVQFPPGPRFCKCIFQYFFCIGDAMLCSSDMKLGVLGVNIITHNVVKFSRYSTSACSNSTRFQFFSIQLSSQYISSHTAATDSSDATKLGVLGKWADTRNVVAPSPARTVWVQIPPGANFFRCRYKQIHLFPAKYRHNVVAPSPARTVWVQIPPGANFFRCRYKQIHLFSAKYSHMPFATLLISSIFILSSVYKTFHS